MDIDLGNATPLGIPLWVLLVILIASFFAMWKLENLYYNFLHSKFPFLFRPRIILAILAAAAVVIIIGMMINPPSEIAKRVEQNSCTYAALGRRLASAFEAIGLKVVVPNPKNKGGLTTRCD